MSEGWSYYLDFDTEVFELKEAELAVGRSRTCDVPINDPSVSRRHVMVKADSGRILLKDLGSSNGTFINGDRVEQGGELHHGDTLALGDAEINVRISGGAASAFETMRMPAQPPSHGDATLFLQKASADLAEEAMDHGEDQEPAPHMAPPPVQPAGAPQPGAPQPGAPQPAAPPQPAPPQVEVAAPAPVIPEPVAPAPPAAPPPQPAAPPPQPAAPPPQPAAPPPPAPQPVAPQPAAPQPAAPPPAAAAPAQQGGQTDLRLDQTTGDLLPSLDGFDITMGPEMMEAVKVEAEEKTVETTPAFNPYSAPMQQQAAAGFGIRLLATIIDWIWMAGISVAGFFVEPQIGPMAALGVTFLVVLFGWAIWGATPGKSICKLYITAGAGGQAGIGFPRALARMVGYTVSSMILGIGFLMIAFNSQRRGLHDMIAGTQVRRAA